MNKVLEIHAYQLQNLQNVVKQINQSIGLTCKLSPGRATLMHNQHNHLSAVSLIYHNRGMDPLLNQLQFSQ